MGGLSRKGLKAQSWLAKPGVWKLSETNCVTRQNLCEKGTKPMKTELCQFSKKSKIFHRTPVFSQDTKLCNAHSVHYKFKTSHLRSGKI